MSILSYAVVSAHQEIGVFETKNNKVSFIIYKNPYEFSQ